MTPQEAEVKKSNDGDTISRAAAIDALMDEFKRIPTNAIRAKSRIEALPSAQPEYEPVKAEDFAKTMSENTLYSFLAGHGEALELMERQGFVICKKTM